MKGRSSELARGGRDANDDGFKTVAAARLTAELGELFVERIECRPILLALKAEGLVLAGELAAVVVGKRQQLLPFVETGARRICPSASPSEPK